jgi:hypothetical protein
MSAAVTMVESAAFTISWPAAIHVAARLLMRVPAHALTTVWLGAAAGSLTAIAPALAAGTERAKAAGSMIAVVAMVAVWWWLCRKGRRRGRVARLLGAKSRALLGSLVRKARELAVPRLVLVPGGAR